jgi:hypothetical protein
MRALVLLVLLLVGASTPIRAEENFVAAQTVIQSQEEALRRDDAETAYTFAAPGIKSLYRSADIFMFMVRNGYAPVYRHRSFEFGEAKIVDGKIVQDVQIVDTEGVAWDALYTLEQQPDGSLKISGCVLTRAATS